MEFGLEQVIDTLTEINNEIIEQKFYEILPSDYVPHIVGQGAWSENILFTNVVNMGGDFETGIIDTGASSLQLAETDINTNSLSSLVATWAKKSLWTIPQIMQAMERRNFDYVSDKLRANKKNWDLGIQKSCFLGLKSNTNFTGLLNNETVDKDTTVITKPISSMSFNEYKEFVAKLFAKYIEISNETALPNRLIIPSVDYYGLIAPLSELNVISRKQLLENSFKEVVGDDFKILPLSYANKAKNASYGINKDRYVLYNYDRDNLRRDIPVDLTQVAINTADNFNLNQVQYGQFSQVTVRRPKTMLYLDLA